MTRAAVGLDGCRDGWVAVRLEDGAVVDVRVVTRAADAVAGVAAAGIDIPIGLLDVADRDADVAARRLLGRRAATVFRTPPRVVAERIREDPATTHADASALAVERTGRGVSVQAFRLLPRILEVDALRPHAPVAEVHPEVAFAVLCGGALARKTSWEGLQRRLASLSEVGVEVPTDFPGAERCAPDDVVDAAVCAWVADALAGAATTIMLPRQPVQHDRGDPVVIHARAPAGADGGWGGTT